jgi:transcriptional antiterminator NusG
VSDESVSNIDSSGAFAEGASALPPHDAASPSDVPPADVVNASESEVPESEAAEAHVEPEPELDPEHEPKGITVESEDEDRPVKMEWYILKVQSNREDSIRDGLKRNVERAGLEKYFDEIIVPIETVTEFKGGKKKTVKRKLYPGYLVVRMEINDDTWYLVRETAGIGDFTGSIGRPSPMSPADIAKILSKTDEKPDDAPRLNIKVKKGDRVKINEGTFENFEGDVDSINEASGRVSVIINIFGRPTPVELEHWQIEAM